MTYLESLQPPTPRKKGSRWTNSIIWHLSRYVGQRGGGGGHCWKWSRNQMKWFFVGSDISIPFFSILLIAFKKSSFVQEGHRSWNALMSHFRPPLTKDIQSSHGGGPLFRWYNHIKPVENKSTLISSTIVYRQHQQAVISGTIHLLIEAEWCIYASLN